MTAAFLQGLRIAGCSAFVVAPPAGIGKASCA